MLVELILKELAVRKFTAFIINDADLLSGKAAVYSCRELNMSQV